MKKLMTIIAMAACAAALTGCTATKIDYTKDDNGKVKYSIWHNGHWLKTEAEQLSGGMSQDGKFDISLQGYKSSPSEEFNKSMQTYMGAIVSAMQIAAAAYNPSASGAVANAARSTSATSATPTVVVNTQQAAETKETAGTKETATTPPDSGASTNAPPETVSSDAAMTSAIAK